MNFSYLRLKNQVLSAVAAALTTSTISLSSFALPETHCPPSRPTLQTPTPNPDGVYCSVTLGSTSLWQNKEIIQNRIEKETKEPIRQGDYTFFVNENSNIQTETTTRNIMSHGELLRSGIRARDDFFRQKSGYQVHVVRDNDQLVMYVSNLNLTPYSKNILANYKSARAPKSVSVTLSKLSVTCSVSESNIAGATP